MIGLALLYFIGKAFYDLAIEYARKKWGFAVLGVVGYYAGTFIGGIILVIISEMNGNTIDESDETWLGFAGIPFGLLAAFILYKLLERSWKRSLTDIADGSLDASLMSGPITDLDKGTEDH